MNADSQWFSPNGIACLLGVITLVGGGFVAYGKVVIGRQDEKRGELGRGLGEKLTSVGLTVVDLANKIHDLEANSAAIEKNYLSRAEHAEYRAEMLAALKDIREAVRQSSETIRADIKEIGERVAKVEARS